MSSRGFDQRTVALLFSTVGAVPLLVFSLVSPDTVKPGGFTCLIGIWGYSVLSAVIAYVRRPIGDRTFALLSLGGMIGIALSAYLMTDQAVGRAILTLLAAVPAMAAMRSRPIEVLGFVAGAVLVAVVYCVATASSFPNFLIGTGATIMTIVIPTSIVLGLRRSLERAIAHQEHASETDPLTQMLNRRGLAAHSTDVVAHAIGIGGGIGFLALDVDNFKSVNDEYGHSVGDDVLVETAHAIRETCDAHALIARFGGEEFVVMCASEDQRALSLMADRIRLAVEHATRVTISVGAVFCPIEVVGHRTVRNEGAGDGSAVLTDRLISAADDYLYQAKQAGRNRVRGGLVEGIRVGTGNDRLHLIRGPRRGGYMRDPASRTRSTDLVDSYVNVQPVRDDSSPDIR